MPLKQAIATAVTIGCLATLFTLASSLPAYADDPALEWDGKIQDDDIQISGESSGSPESSSGTSAVGRGRALPLCDPAVTMASGSALAECAANKSVCFASADGTPGYAFVYWHDTLGNVSTWTVECLPSEEPLAVTISDFAVMKIPPPVAVRQPDRELSLVNVPLVVYAEPGARVFTATVLGQEVSIRATPVAYKWDFHDASATSSNPSVIHSRTPGQPYPNHTITHTYHRVGPVSQSLTTTFRGEYATSPNPGPSDWIPIPGTAQNTVELPAHEVVETRPQLEKPR